MEIVETLPKEEVLSISETLNELVFSFEQVRTPGISEIRRKNTALTQKQEELIAKLSGVHPDYLTEAIFSDPPTVRVAEVQKDGNSRVYELNPGTLTIIPPSEEDILFFKKEIEVPDGPGKMLVGSGLKGVKRFLTTPRVKDQFTDHQNERYPWEAGVLETLKLLDESFGSKDGVSGYGKTFKDKWDANRYTYSYQDGVKQGLQITAIGLDMAGLESQTRRIMKLEDKYLVEVDKEENDEIRVKNTLEIAKEAINILAK